MYPYYGGPGGYPAMQTHSHGLGAPVGVPVHQMQPTSPVAPGIHYSQQFSSTSLTGSSGHFRRAGPGSSVLTSTGGALAGSGGPRASTGGALAGSGGPRAQSSFIIQQQQQQQHVQHPPGGHSQVPHGHVQTAHGAIQQSHTPAASKPSQQQSAYGVPVAHGSLGSKTENRLTGAVASVSPLATAMAAQSRQQVGETGGRRSPLSGTVGDADIARCRASLTLLKRKIKERSVSNTRGLP
uniref:Uncharacterized protein n=1 Tax=Chromera velia CCMP2878 TaxID=1169474 RepID=A0A0G4HTJ6_9ALVE|eukprot:Cvel_1361.t1-p1 / transcript=Cvel_1361.t1 / gene=Cvel_1361 / organism=Chromera_velia_CCMP2878 / gene_product=hypothetical protein / transcript_product=hypothetical protein / location=Cvel_scaffold46:164428-165594(+) / protein_length=238 / sequence_SO=supercontig / SO=protein_coding / is_pseudo=false